MPRILGINSGEAPIGEIAPFGGTTAPRGWVLCDGSSLVRTDYPELFAVIGTAFGAVNGTEFNVPDLRGRFLRGVDGGAGRDPDAASRTAMNTGGNTGNNVGSVQPDQYKEHVHNLYYRNLVVPGDGINSLATPGNQATAGNMAGTLGAGGNETRPINAYANYIIKYA